jgi:hypothetical protein
VQKVLSSDLWTEIRKQARASKSRKGAIAYATRDLVGLLASCARKVAAHLVRASVPLAGKSVRKDAIRWSIRRRSLARPAHRSGFRRVPSFRKPSILFAERR